MFSQLSNKRDSYHQRIRKEIRESQAAILRDKNLDTVKKMNLWNSNQQQHPTNTKIHETPDSEENIENPIESSEHQEPTRLFDLKPLRICERADIIRTYRQIREMSYYGVIDPQSITQEFIGEVLGFLSCQDLQYFYIKLVVETLNITFPISSQDAVFASLPAYHRRIVNTGGYPLQDHQLTYIFLLSERYNIRPEFDSFSQALVNTYYCCHSKTTQNTILNVIKNYLVPSKSLLNSDSVSMIRDLFSITIECPEYSKNLKTQCKELMTRKTGYDLTTNLDPPKKYNAEVTVAKNHDNLLTDKGEVVKLVEGNVLFEPMDLIESLLRMDIVVEIDE